MKPVCLITGAGGLLGNALCNQLSDDYNIVATYRTSIPKHSSQFVKRLSPQDNNDIFCIQGDLMKKEDIKKIVDITMAKFGQIDVIVNNAVDYSMRVLLELYQNDDYATSQFCLNSVVPFQIVSYIHQNCWKESSEINLAWNRNVLNISSISAVNVYPTSGAFYSASKAALNMLTLHLAQELDIYRVRVNALCPGHFSNYDGAKYYALKVKELIQGSISGSIITEL